MRYVVAIGNFLFHIELYYCNKLNLYFTSNFVDVIEVSNWVTGRFEKLTLFFSLISSLSPMSILFFFSSQYFSLTTRLPFFSHLNFPLSLTTSIFLFFLNSKLTYKCLSIFFLEVLRPQYFYNIFTTNHWWLVIIGSNLNLTLRLLFCPNNNNQ